MKYEIEFEGVPEGCEPVRFGPPKDGEDYLAPDGKVRLASGEWDDPRLIVRKKQTVKPWTFETAPGTVKAKRNGEDTVLLIAFYNGEFKYWDTRLYSYVSFENVLKLYTKLDSSPCGEVCNG